MRSPADCREPPGRLAQRGGEAVSGLGITLGNLAVGALWDYAARHDARCLPWLALAATGLLCAAAVHRLARTGRLPHPAEEAAASPA
ncbi:hypothetical protein [Kitasatospora griseola]|uniref:hypothetical protein n=1 Tax=Kitasatospora griseola TaxID=2064 RepID=UPI003F4DC4BD